MSSDAILVEVGRFGSGFIGTGSWTEISRAVLRLRGPRPGGTLRGQLTFAEYNIRCPEDLHAICTRSASLLDTREFRCVTRAKAHRGIGDMVRLRQADAFLQKPVPAAQLVAVAEALIGVS